MRTPISAIGNSRRRAVARPNGFSLVELAIVLVIIGLLASAVVLTLPDRGERPIRAGEAFAARALAAQEAAIVESQDIALWVSPAGYGFERHESGNWLPIAQPPFEDRTWPDGMTVSYARAPDSRVRIIFDATGLNDPFDLTLTRDNESATVHIGADGIIRVES